MDTMKVLLINPPTEHIIRESLPAVVEDSTGVYPPLGLLYVAAYAEDVAGSDVRVLDCQAENVGHDDLPQHISAAAPDVVGIQVMTFTLIDAARCAKAVRAAAPGAFVVFGGPHATLYPEESAAIEEVDAVVVGEGEFPFAALLTALRDGTSAESVPAVVTKASVACGAARPALSYIEDLDALKMPARHLIDARRYYSPMATHRRAMTMMSSRGCPYQCTFCDRPQMGKRFRKRSAQSVFREMAACVQELGVGEIFFYDDTFTVDKQRVVDICDLILDSKLKVLWDIRARIDTMTPQVVEKLRAAGCVRIHYGVETGCQRLQAEIGKNLDLAKVSEVFDYTRRAGIETLGYFMLGLPTETRRDLDETLDLLVRLPMDYAHIGIFTPYPGTAVYRQALETGVYDTDHWREFARRPTPDFSPRYWNQTFSDAELFDLLKTAYARFYRRPRYLLRRLLKIRSATELVRKASLGIKLLTQVSR